MSLPRFMSALVFATALARQFSACQETCHGKDDATCFCDLRDNSGTIDLRSLKNHTLDLGAPWWFVVPDSEALFYYYYNPCYPFDFCNSKHVAISRSPGDPGFPCEDVGTFDSSRFYRDANGGVVIKYTSGDKLRTGTVYLLCNQSQTTAQFRPLEHPWKHKFDIHFTLTGAEACIGPTSKQRLGTGAVVMICLGSALLVYLLIGVSRNLCKRKTPQVDSQQFDAASRVHLTRDIQPKAGMLGREEYIDDETHPIPTLLSINYHSLSDTSPPLSE